MTKQPSGSPLERLLLTKPMGTTDHITRIMGVRTLSVLMVGQMEWISESGVAIEHVCLSGIAVWRHVFRDTDEPLYLGWFSGVRHFYRFIIRDGGGESCCAVVVGRNNKYYHIWPNGKACYQKRFTDITDVRVDGTALVIHPKRKGWYRIDVMTGHEVK